MARGVHEPNNISTTLDMELTLRCSVYCRSKFQMPLPGMSSSESDIKKLCPEAIVLKVLPLRGGSVSKAGPEIDSWLRRNGLL